MGRSRAARIPQDPLTVHIESMSQDGMGVARVDGRSVYIHGALSGETVLFRYTRIRVKQAEVPLTGVDSVTRQGAGGVSPVWCVRRMQPAAPTSLRPDP